MKAINPFALSHFWEPGNQPWFMMDLRQLVSNPARQQELLQAVDAFEAKLSWVHLKLLEHLERQGGSMKVTGHREIEAMETLELLAVVSIVERDSPAGPYVIMNPCATKLLKMMKWPDDCWQLLDGLAKGKACTHCVASLQSLHSMGLIDDMLREEVIGESQERMTLWITDAGRRALRVRFCLLSSPKG
jgi:hypothetical protein